VAGRVPRRCAHGIRPGEIRHWLEVFLKRFFANQFKRSALPNGPKVVRGGSLSPRGDWRMPSDASARVWLDELPAGSRTAEARRRP
jgi:NAD+ synthase (glutamine-hydrolysing)